jgi:hypothetical protein
MQLVSRCGIARGLLGATLALVTACSSPVDWTPTRALVQPASGAGALTADGSLVPDTIAALAARIGQLPGAVCPGSLRLASARTALIGVWWAPRPDSGARLLAARSSDGGRSWSAPTPVDTVDQSVTGCRREPPAITADAATGYVHVTYALLAPEGPGLFFSHSMDGGLTFHAPVPIMYGDRLGGTSVASDGDLVVVGFEDPNSATPRVGLAISHTMGHIFENRVVPVSDDNGAATDPMTAIRGSRVAVAWRQHATASGPAALMVRVGTVR